MRARCMWPWGSSARLSPRPPAKRWSSTSARSARSRESSPPARPPTWWCCRSPASRSSRRPAPWCRARAQRRQDLHRALHPAGRAEARLRHARELQPAGQGAHAIATSDGAEVALAPAGPDPPRRPELGDLLEEVDVRIEEERQPRREPLDVQPAGQPELDVPEPVGEGERELLRGGRAGLPDVVAGHRQRLVRAGSRPRRTPSGRRSAAGAARARTATPSARCTP